MIDYSYVGAPLDGHTVRVRQGAAMCRAGDGRPLPVSAGDRAVAQMNRGRDPEPVYARFSGRYIWLPARAAQLRAEREARQVQDAELDASYLREEQERRAGARRQAKRGGA